MIKQYLGYFKWLFILTGVGVLAYGGILFRHASSGPMERTNTECEVTERVFDYGEVLTDQEEESLRQLIAKRERQTGCDILLVTLNQSLKNYAREKEPSVPYNEFVRVFAEDFYDSNGFGYDKPVGDGVILVDNWYREDDGSIYTWFSAIGKPEETYYNGSRNIERLLDSVYRYIERNPYKAYRAYVNDIYHDMTGKTVFNLWIPFYVPLGAAAVAMLIFVVSHWKSKKGEKTVTANTYVGGGRPHLNRKEDIFLTKTITKRRIQTNSGGSSRGGGGGSHGGRHSGGGRSR